MINSKFINVYFNKRRNFQLNSNNTLNRNLSKDREWDESVRENARCVQIIIHFFANISF